MGMSMRMDLQASLGSSDFSQCHDACLESFVQNARDYMYVGYLQIHNELSWDEAQF